MICGLDQVSNILVFHCTTNEEHISRIMKIYLMSCRYAKLNQKIYNNLSLYVK